ncbi:hypothetical protein QQZ08_005906 [Neonectria magnoliae]|uniref:NACHT domain-containing protein n=1 Tax=Neonectria magnoliae TaxID=2732573 RepID=A0ABR1I2E6_9HYPO
MTDRNEYKRLKVDVGSSSYVQLGNNTYTSGAESASTVTDLLRELFITDPSEDLSKTQRIKGDRTKETCEWILERYEYTNWLRGRGLHLLWLVGPPGSGKTVISCFLVEKLQKFIEESPPSTFAYYICDNKDEHRNTASCILQGIIVQLLQTRKHLFGCVAEDYKIRKGRLSGNLPALGTIFRRILKSWTDPVYLLIDALDECEDESRGELLHLLSRLEESTNLRIMITSRPKPFTPQTGHVRIDILLNSYEINSDLSKFIDDKVKTFEKKYPSKFVDEVKEAVLRRVDGTFLWASFMLDEIATATTTKSARDKLSRMPASLEESYERMLNDIPDEDKKDAALIFQWVVVSRRPMTTVELATVMTLNSPKPWNSKAAPQGEDVEEQLDLYKSCRQLLYLDTTDDTVNLIHQSAKDYLTTLHHSSPYFINEKQAEMQIMDTCWNYLCLGFPAERVQIFSRTEQNELKWNCLSFVHVQMFRFLKYAGEEMGDNWMMTNAERIAAFVRHREDLDDIPNLRDQWLTQFVQYGDVDSVKILCEKGANTNVGSWGSPLLHVAVNRGNIEICKLLAYYGADIDCLNSRGDSALLCAIKEKHAAGAAWLLQKKSRLDRGPELIEGALTHGMEDVALLLLKAGAISNYESQSPTASQFWDPTMARSKSKTAIMNSLLFEAVRKGFYEVTKEIIQARANPASRGLNLLNRPALAGAVKAGHLTIARLLIDAGAGVGLIPGRDEQCYLGLAIKHDQIPMMELLIECGAEMEATECWGNPMLWDDEFPLSALCIASAEGNIEAADVLLKAGAKLGVGALHRAAERGHQDMVTYLLDQGEDPEGRDLFCESMTALHLAAHAGAESTIDLLVKRGANIDGRDHNGRTALHHALMYHLDLRSIMSLVRHGADVNAKTNEGQTALHIFSLYGLQSDPTEIQATQAIQILLSDGLDVNSADCHGKTALHYAAEKTNIALAKVLLDHGAFIDSPDSNGATPLHLAVAAGVHPSDMWRPKYRRLHPYNIICAFSFFEKD